MSDAKDLWYKFFVVTERLEIRMTSTGSLQTPSIALYQYQGNCNALIPLGCAQGNGTVIKVFESLTVGMEYFLQVSGNGNADAGTFNITMTSLNSCDECVKNTYFDVSPLPASGGYPPNTTVNMCFSVIGYDGSGGNLLHGFYPVLGSGWAAGSLTPVSAPVTAGNQGQWIWTTPTPGNLGYYFDANGNNIVSDNAGDQGSFGTVWTACWSATTSTNCSGTAPIDVQIFTTSDAETGNNSVPGCAGDTAFTFDPWAICCTGGPTFVNATAVSCSGVSADGSIGFMSGTVPYDYILVDVYGVTVSSATGSTNSTAVINSLDAGTYYLYIYTGTCWSGTTVVIQPSMDITAYQSDFGCENVPGSGGAVAYTSGGSGPYTFTWLENGNPFDTNTHINPLDSISGMNDGNTYEVTITDAAGCFVTATVYVDLQPADVVNFMYQGDSVCLNFGDTLFVTSQPDVSGGTYFMQSRPVNSTAGINTATGTFIPDQPGTYIIKYETATVSSSICPNLFYDTVLVGFHPPPPVATTPTYLQICAGQTPIPALGASATSMGTVVIWYENPNLTFPAGYGNSYTPTDNTTVGSTYYYAFQIMTAAPYCTNLSGVLFEYAVLGIQPVDAGQPQVTICPGDTVQLFGTAPNVSSVLWNPPLLVSDTAAFSPMAWPTATTMFYLTAFPLASSLCTGVDSILVIVDNSGACDSSTVVLPTDSMIPNGFTPNGDGLNDSWVIDAIDTADNEVIIFNRWGDVVWRRTGYDNSRVVWRGEHDNGTKLPEGTYFYLITSGTKRYKNWIELSR